jgi:uncharacterized protein (DUF342 family)
MSDDAIKERFNTVDKEIEKHEKRLNNLEKTYQVMEKMEYRMEQIEKSITAINGKLDNQATEKGKKWDKLIDYLKAEYGNKITSYECNGYSAFFNRKENI